MVPHTVKSGPRRHAGTLTWLAIHMMGHVLWAACCYFTHMPLTCGQLLWHVDVSPFGRSLWGKLLTGVGLSQAATSLAPRRVCTRMVQHPGQVIPGC